MNAENRNRGEPVAALPEADDAYLALMRRCPLRPIRSEAELDRAIATLDWLVDRGTAGRRTASEEDYLLVLARLVEQYEDDHHPMSADRAGDGGP